MKKYYLYNGIRQCGPFGLAELKHQHLLWDTPVWYEGLSEWVKAGTVPELQALLPPATPPPFLLSNNQPEVPVMRSGTPVSRIKTRFVNRILFLAALLVLFLLVTAIVVVSVG